MSCVGSRVKYIGNVYGMFYKEGIIVKENADIVQVEFDNGIILYLYKKDVVIIESDDYYMDEDGELVCRCPECPMNPNYDHWEE